MEDLRSTTVPDDPVQRRDLILLERARDGDLDAFNDLVVALPGPAVRARRADGPRSRPGVRLPSRRRSSRRTATCARSVAAASSRGSTGSASTPRWTRSAPGSAGPVQPYPELEDESWQPPAGAEADPERTALDAERTRALAGALAGITDDQRTAIVLFDVEGYDYAEIADMTGVSLGTVKSRIHRGRLALRGAARGSDGAVPWLTHAIRHADHDPLLVASLLDGDLGAIRAGGRRGARRAIARTARRSHADLRRAVERHARPARPRRARATSG